MPSRKSSSGPPRSSTPERQQRDAGDRAREEVPALICNFLQSPKSLPHFWEHTVGSGHAPLALRADWQAQMRRSHEELGFSHVRFHGLLCDDMGTLVAEGDTLFYSFFNADQVFDFLLSIGMRPFVELSFMPG